MGGERKGREEKSLGILGLTERHNVNVIKINTDLYNSETTGTHNCDVVDRPQKQGRVFGEQDAGRLMNGWSARMRTEGCAVWAPCCERRREHADVADIITPDITEQHVASAFEVLLLGLVWEVVRRISDHSGRLETLRVSPYQCSGLFFGWRFLEVWQVAVKIAAMHVHRDEARSINMRLATRLVQRCRVSMHL